MLVLAKVLPSGAKAKLDTPLLCTERIGAKTGGVPFCLSHK
jgi:hypothetical protein